MDLTKAQSSSVNKASSNEVVAQRLPRVHRSIQLYIALAIVDDITNDTMLPLERRLIDGNDGLCHSRLDDDEDDSSCSSDEDYETDSGKSTDNEEEDDPLKHEAGELNADFHAGGGWSKTSKTSCARSVFGWKRLMPKDVPEMTLPFAAYSDTHDRDNLKKKTTRLLSSRPKYDYSYNKKLQRPSKTAAYHSEEFAQVKHNNKTGEMTDIMRTSFVREHALRSLQQKYFVSRQNNLDAVWRVWEDFDNCVRAPLVNVYAQFALIPSKSALCVCVCVLVV